jgi:hypothetical protein
MPGPRSHRITDQFIHQVCAYTRAGGYPHVAARAAGVPVAVFEQWLRWGRRRSGNPLYRQLCAELDVAAAQARLKAEIDTLRKRPEFWLRHGLGRETVAAPGWSSPSRPAPAEPPSPLCSPDFQRVIVVLLQALEPYPEARIAAAAALDALPEFDED